MKPLAQVLFMPQKPNGISYYELLVIKKEHAEEYCFKEIAWTLSDKKKKQPTLSTTLYHYVGPDKLFAIETLYKLIDTKFSSSNWIGEGYVENCLYKKVAISPESVPESRYSNLLWDE